MLIRVTEFEVFTRNTKVFILQNQKRISVKFYGVPNTLEIIQIWVDLYNDFRSSYLYFRAFVNSHATE